MNINLKTKNGKESEKDLQTLLKIKCKCIGLKIEFYKLSRQEQTYIATKPKIRQLNLIL